MGRKSRKSTMGQLAGGLPAKALAWFGDGTEEYQLCQIVLDKLDGKVSVRLNQKLVTVNRELLHLADSRAITKDGESTSFAKGMNDMVTLTPPNVANILHLLKERSTKYDSPYTFVGPVLISVNPLRKTEDQAKKGPHPHRIAEAALKQMQFAKITNQPLDQSIIVSGESGAGKTEASKRVLQRLVSKAVHDGDGKKGRTLDKRLIETNPILEAFGNATTLRNRNSSRFGKFMKLHINKKSDIVGASVETYLLERSRVSGFVFGECNYHVFYILIGGADKSLMKSLGLLSKAKQYKYLVPLMTDGDRDDSVKINRPDSGDKEEFPELCTALSTIGIDEKMQTEVFKVLAAILHLGNVEIEGGKDHAEISDDDAALKLAAKLLSVDPSDLVGSFSEKMVVAAGEVMMAKLSGNDATKARDAVAKQMYSHLFDYVVKSINDDLTSKKSDVKAFIGVLDIFGFETFQYNDLEQLLINYTNEALHGIFLQKVFDAELSMYVQEGLVPEGDTSITVPENVECLKLLKGSESPKIQGVLDVIVDSGNQPNPSDSAMNKQLHRQFGANSDYFPKVHPKDIEHQFKVKHFPGHVTYHIGNFLSKNHDKLPKSVEILFAEKSESKLVKSLWIDAFEASKAAESGARGRKNKKESIVSKFKHQIELLSDTLNASQCSFIRCIKPNFKLQRPDDDSPEWFVVPYINAQLSCLGIEPTVQVLSKGMPNRLSYSDLTETYKELLPKDAMKAWKKYGGGEKLFISALFWAFGISKDTYKLGFKYVFFKSGDLEELEKVLESASSLGEKELKKIGKNFKGYMAHKRWLQTFANLRVYYRFHCMLQDMREQVKKKKKKKEKQIILAQSVVRRYLANNIVYQMLEEQHQQLLEEQKEIEEEEKQAREAAAKKKMDAIAETSALDFEDGARFVREMQEYMALTEREADQEVNMEVIDEEVDKVEEMKEDAKESVKKLTEAMEEQKRAQENMIAQNTKKIAESRYNKQQDDEEEGMFLMRQAMLMRDQGGEVDDERFDKEKAAMLNAQKARAEGRLKELDAYYRQLEKQRDEAERRLAKLNLETEKKFSKLKVKFGKDAGFNAAIALTRQMSQAHREVRKLQLKNRDRLLKVEARKRRMAGRLDHVKKISEQKLDRVTDVFQNSKQYSRFKSKKAVVAKKQLESKKTQMSFMQARTLENIKFQAVKQARKSKRNWKKRFFVLNQASLKLDYMKGKGRSVKGTYLLSTESTISATSIGKREYVLEISDPKSGEMRLELPSAAILTRVHLSLEGAIDAKRVEMRLLNEMEVENEEESDHNSSSGSFRMKKQNSFREGGLSKQGSFVQMNIPKQDMDDSLFESLHESLEDGTITQEEFEMLANGEEVLLEKAAEANQNLDFNTQVMCSCGTMNNSQEGLHCSGCKKRLEISLVYFL